MKNLLENLDAYLKTNSKEKILKDWADTAHWDEVGGVIINDFISYHTFTFTNNEETQNHKISSEFNSSSFLFC